MMNETLQAVVDYVETPQTDYALLLTGPWGCGKTYFWKNVVQPELRETCMGDEMCRPLYASLYGCQSAKDVDAQLFIASYPRLQEKWTARLASVGGGYGKRLLKVFTRFELPAIDLRWLVRTKNSVLCFDDLERTQLPMKEALGYVNTFVEHEGVKVIILCNEDAISDADDKKTYREMKEKVVGASLAFRADLDVVFETLVHEHQARPEFHKFLVTNGVLLRRLFDRSETHNIRSLRRAFSALAVIFEALRSHNLDPNMLAERLIYVVAPGSFELHGRSVEPDQLRELLNTDNMAVAGWIAKSHMKDENAEAGEHALKAEFAERYFEGIGLAEWRTPVGCPPICKYLLTGALDRRALFDWAEQLIKPPDEREVRIKRLTCDPDDMTDDEFADAAERTIAEFERGDVALIGSYFRLFRALEWMADAGLIAPSRQELLEKFTGGLTKARERNILEAEPPLASALKHPSFAPTTEEQRTLRQRVLEVNEELLQAKLRERAKSLMSSFNEHPERFFEALSDDGEEGWAYKAVFHQLPIDEFGIRLLQATNPLKVRFLRALHVRYEHRPGTPGFTVELPALEQLKESLNSRVMAVAERPMKMSAHLNGEIVKMLDAVISRMPQASSEGAVQAARADANVSKKDGDDETK